MNKYECFRKQYQLVLPLAWIYQWGKQDEAIYLHWTMGKDCTVTLHFTSDLRYRSARLIGPESVWIMASHCISKDMTK